MKKPSKFRFFVRGCALVLFLILAGCVALYFLWYRNINDVPLAAALDLPTLPETFQTGPSEPAASTLAPGASQITATPPKPGDPVTKAEPLCGAQAEWTVLVVGSDQRGTDYLYGLADVIRVVRIDFTKPQLNVAALPRNLIVNTPTRLEVPEPILLNQAYLFGAPGMNYYRGSGNGAGALAETIQSNFGITPDHYLVVNYQAFVDFVNAIGGIEVDLPTYVDDRPNSYFPPGKQTLNGQQALNLGRIRAKYSDLVRIDNQTLILKAVFTRLRSPAVWPKLPTIYKTLKKSVITDVTPNQISNLFCLLTKVDAEDLVFFNPPDELMVYDWAFIPTMNQDMQIFRWDPKFTAWFRDSLGNSR